MSQQPVTQVVVQQSPSNGLGTAGFVISLVGLLTCGLICPLGLLFSFFGLFKPPRGLAIAGTVIGLLGSLWMIFFGFALVAGLLGFGAAVDEAMKEAERQAQERAAEMELEIDEGAIPDPQQPALDATSSNASNSGGLNLKQEELDSRDEAIDSSAREEDPSPKATAEEPEFRTWTDSTGEFKVTAKLGGRLDDTVRLIKEDGSTITVPIEKLSAEDKAFLMGEKE